MRLTRCRLRHCRSLRDGASVKALYVDAAFRNNTVVKLSFVLLLVGSCFSSPACITVTKSSTSEDRTHDLKIMRLTRCRLRHCRCLRYGASVKLLEPCTLMRHSGITVIKFFVQLLVGASFSSPACNTVTKTATSEDRTHDLKIMRLTRCRLRHCRSLRDGASVKALYVDAAFRNNTVVKLSLCCFWLALVFPLQPVLLWQKVRQVRTELTT